MSDEHLDVEEYMNLSREQRVLTVAATLFQYMVKDDEGNGYLDQNPLEPTEKGFALGEFGLARGDRLTDMDIADVINAMVRNELICAEDWHQWYTGLRNMSIANAELIKEERDDESV